jgi:hypothetical protein
MEATKKIKAAMSDWLMIVQNSYLWLNIAQKVHQLKRQRLIYF